MTSSLETSALGNGLARPCMLLLVNLDSVESFQAELCCTNPTWLPSLQLLLLEVEFQYILEVVHLSVLVTCCFFKSTAHQLLQDAGVFYPRCVTSPVQLFYDDHGYSPWNIALL